MTCGAISADSQLHLTLVLTIKFYVGKTSGDGASRFCRHKSDVNTGKDKAVPNHFNLPGHSSSDMRFLPFEALKGGGDATLLASREQYWIDKKKTFVFGINRQK